MTALSILADVSARLDLETRLQVCRFLAPLFRRYVPKLLQSVPC